MKLYKIISTICFLTSIGNITFAQSATLSITAPAYQSIGIIGEDISIAATLSDLGYNGSVSFFIDSVYIGDGYGTNGSVVYDWAPATQGNHNITAYYIDGLGDTIKAAPISFSINVIPAQPYEFGEGLESFYNFVQLGGDINYGLNLTFNPEGYYYCDGCYVFNNITGSLDYDNTQGAFDYYTAFQSNDSTGSMNGYDFSALTASFDLYGEINSGSSLYRYTNIYGTPGDANGTDPGLSLTVVGSGITDPNNGIQIYANGMDLNTPGIQFNYFLNNASEDSVLTTDSLGNLKMKLAGGGGRWKTSGSNTYDTTDNIGIGTSNPQSKLAVAGTITAQKVKVTQTGWSDYVFDRNYSLPHLSEVEKYIVKNKHLPDIPSAKDVETNGIDIGANQSLLLKKIEELTLYSIQQNKTIAAQDDRLLSQVRKLDQQAQKLKELEDKLNKLLSKQN